MQHDHLICPDPPLSLEALGGILSNPTRLSLSEESIRRIERCRRWLDEKLAPEQSGQAQPHELFYGINTGFGSLCDVRVPDDKLEQLQLNLVMSHACGMGDEVPPDIVRGMLLLKIQGLAQGFSGVQVATVQRLADFFDHDVLPVVFEQGSLGASGDLAPLAHLSLPLTGLGEVRVGGGERMPAAAALERFGWQPLRFQSKEALALLNGTQFCCAYAAWCLLESQRLLSLANRCAALSLDAFDCRLTPFDERLQNVRPHQGQKLAAEAVRRFLENSEIAARPKSSVQDPYSFRCVPQVHGATGGALAHVGSVVFTEINSVTDNPTLFPDDGDPEKSGQAILSGGNFHAQPLALALDYLAIAAAELGSISERRTFQLLSGQRGLPPFLVKNGGLNSGLMIPQYTAASIVSQNKQLCTPASVDSITSSNGQEDHVSMGANAATKAMRVVKNVERVLAVEWLTAAQAMEFRRPARTSPGMEELLASYRQVVPPLDGDRILSADLERTVAFLKKIQ